MISEKNIIFGVKIFKKKVISDKRGKILHMLRNDDKHFSKFGEIYFSYVFGNQVKAWHIHKKMTLNYCAAFGVIKLVLYDNRKKSRTFGVFQEIILSNKNHCLVSIPPNIWNGFRSANGKLAVLANCSNIPHDPKEIKRIHYRNKEFAYDWRI
jgi:dTDP-4-dehydrorhamnose 3,5-epimerase